MRLAISTLLLLYPWRVVVLCSLDATFAIEYFKYRRVQDVCVLHCEGDSWIMNFTKTLSEYSIRVFSVKTDQSLNDKNLQRLGMCLRQSLVSIGVLVDTKCVKFEEVMKFASQNAMLDATRKWLFMMPSEDKKIPNPSSVDKSNFENIVHILGASNISVDSDLLFAVKEGRHHYELHEIYNFGKIQGGDLIISKSGICCTNGFETNLNEFKYYRRWNFHQWPMRMISVVSPAPKVFDPKILTEPNWTPGVASITKTSVTILNVISEIHNLRFEHSTADRWIGDYSIRNFQIVASAIYYRQQDISPIIRFMKEVYDKIDIVHPPLTSIETRYFYRIPTYGAGKFENQFLRPLSAGAWLCVVAVITLCASVLLISAKWERRASSGQYAIFSALASICQQFFEDNAGDTRIVSNARKLTVLVTGISCVLIYNYYTSSVVSWLLNGPPPSINSLQELLDSPLELIFEDIGYTRSWLQTPSFYYNRRNARIEDEMRKKKVFNKRKDAPLFESLESGITMVKAGGYAYHTDTDSASRLISRTFTQTELCELGSLQSIEKTLLYPCVQKNSPYKEFLTWSLMRLLERGIVRCIQQRTRSPSVKCDGSSPRALALGGAAPAFLLLLGGYIMAIVIMLVERRIWNYSNGRTMKFTQ